MSASEARIPRPRFTVEKIAWLAESAPDWDAVPEDIRTRFYALLAGRSLSETDFLARILELRAADGVFQTVWKRAARLVEAGTREGELVSPGSGPPPRNYFWICSDPACHFPPEVGSGRASFETGACPDHGPLVREDRAGLPAAGPNP